MQEDSKAFFTHKEMLEAVKASRSPGYSKTGRKLKRRTVQPHKEREKLRWALLAFATVLFLSVMAGVWWFLVRQQAASPGGGPPAGIPTTAN